MPLSRPAFPGSFQEKTAVEVFCSLWFDAPGLHHLAGKESLKLVPSHQDTRSRCEVHEKLEHLKAPNQINRLKATVGQLSGSAFHS
jgi:hypothetical protein